MAPVPRGVERRAVGLLEAVAVELLEPAAVAVVLEALGHRGTAENSELVVKFKFLV